MGTVCGLNENDSEREIPIGFVTKGKVQFWADPEEQEQVIKSSGSESGDQQTECEIVQTTENSEMVPSQ